MLNSKWFIELEFCQSLLNFILLHPGQNPLSRDVPGQNELKFFKNFKSISSRVSNGTGQRNFSGQRDSQNFFVPGQRDNGTEVPSLSRDKGTTGQAQNLAKGRDGPGQPKPGTGRAGTAKIRDGTRDKTGQSRKGCSKTV